MEKDTLRKNVYAFNNNDIVATYDFDMDIWHPNRTKMVELACEILPFKRTEPLKFLDLGVGTGHLSHKIITSFPNASIIAIDAAELMIEKAKIRLQNHLKQITFHISTFQELPNKKFALPDFDAVVSSFALHHLYREEKLALFKYVRSILKPNGWFVNCDIFKTADALLEARFRHLHYLGIQDRLRKAKQYEKPIEQIASELSEKEKNDGDHLLLVTDDLQTLTEAGFRTAECFWKEYREAVYGGIK